MSTGLHGTLEKVVLAVENKYFVWHDMSIGTGLVQSERWTGTR